MKKITPEQKRIYSLYLGKKHHDAIGAKTNYSGRQVNNVLGGFTVVNNENSCILTHADFELKKMNEEISKYLNK